MPLQRWYARELDRMHYFGKTDRWFESGRKTKALITPAGFALALALGLSGYSNPYDPG
jgi:hypothetical protein